MLSILTLRTDKPEAELGLYKDSQQLAYKTWFAHRQLAETIHLRIAELLKSQKVPMNELQGIVVFKGPGSFTGLRIGIAVANALADSLEIPIVSSAGEQWAKVGCNRLGEGENEQLVLPEYGSLPHVTLPRK